MCIIAIYSVVYDLKLLIMREHSIDHRYYQIMWRTGRF